MCHVPLHVARRKTPPKVLVYDNACQTANYWLNREPLLARNTLFLVDKLHWPTHTRCCEAFHIGAYKEYKKWNSQLAEQQVTGKAASTFCAGLQELAIACR